MQHRAATKMISQIAGVEDVGATEEFIQARRAPQSDNEDDTEPESAMRDRIITDRAVILYMQTFKLSSSRQLGSGL